MIDVQDFATGFACALILALLVGTPLFECMRRAVSQAHKGLRDARETIEAQQEDIDSLFEILPMRLSNGRFAKRGGEQ